MYAQKKFKLLPSLMLLLGIAGLTLKLFQNSFGTDSADLLIPWHPSGIALDAVIMAAVFVAAYGCSTIQKTKGYLKSFPGSLRGTIGHGAAALGIWYTVWPRIFAMEGNLGVAWTALGLASVVTLGASAWFRFQGKQPHFLLHLCPALFFAAHIILNYRGWSGDPQLPNYLFTMMALISMMFFSFYHCAFDAGLEWRRRLTFFGLLSICLCITAIPGNDYPWLFVGSAFWALTDRPAPATRKRRQRPTMDEVSEE